MKIHWRLAPDAPLSVTTLRTIPDLFAHAGETIHKARNEIKVLDIEGIRCVVKAFRPPSLLRRLGYALRRTKAEASYENSRKLLQKGVDTPEPIGYLLLHRGSRLYSYYISRYLPHDFSLQKVLRTPDLPEREAILQAFGTFTAQLHEKGVWHRDFSQGNILVTRSEEGWRFALVDVNRMDFGPVSGRKGPKNFAKLWIDEATMRTIVQAYALARGIDEKRALATALAADAAVKRAKNFRRALKRRVGLLPA